MGTKSFIKQLCCCHCIKNYKYQKAISQTEIQSQVESQHNKNKLFAKALMRIERKKFTESNTENVNNCSNINNNESNNRSNNNEIELT